MLWVLFLIPVLLVGVLSLHYLYSVAGIILIPVLLGNDVRTIVCDTQYCGYLF